MLSLCLTCLLNTPTSIAVYKAKKIIKRRFWWYVAIRNQDLHGCSILTNTEFFEALSYHKAKYHSLPLIKEISDFLIALSS